jgi:hypothetical protein
MVKMEFFVGTSGWYYSWNEERNFDWYVANSRRMLRMFEETFKTDLTRAR